MVETLNLEHIPTFILQNITETPKTIQIEGDDVEYSAITKNPVLNTLNSFNGSSNNLLINGNDRILFANTYESLNVFENIKYNELIALIEYLFDKLAIFRFEEDISFVYVDKILSNLKNLVKISELPKLEVDYIISSNLPIVVSSNKDVIRCVSSGISINRLSEIEIRDLLISELNNSFMIVNISNKRSVDIEKVYSTLTQFSQIIKFDKKNKMFAIKMKRLANLEKELIMCNANHIIRDLLITDRTNWLHASLK